MDLMTGPTGLLFNYSDPFRNPCAQREPAAANCYFGLKFGRPGAFAAEVARMDERHTFGRVAAFALFWSDGSAASASNPVLCRSLGGSNPVAILRTGLGPDDWYVGVKGGRPSSNHGHMDGGSFVLDAGGVRWAYDLGCEPYNRIEQMKTVSLWSMSQESSRWSLLRLNTFGHNVPRIGDAQQSVKGFAKFVNAVDSPAPSAIIDLTSLYPAAKKATRVATLSKDGKTFEVSDAFTGLKPGTEVHWQFVLKAKASAKGGNLSLTDGDHALNVVREGTKASAWSVAEAEGPKPLNSPNPGFSIASFRVRAGEDGKAPAKVRLALAK
jgi:hypothetical protein